MKKSCFVSPIHKAKFEDGVNLIRSYNEHFKDDDIFLVFSSQQESEEFKNSFGELKYQTIISQNYDSRKGVVTLKKIYGLKHIFENTNFVNVGVVDADSEFFCHKDYDFLFEEYVKNTTLYSNGANGVQTVISSPKKFFNVEENKKIDELINNEYFWFNEIPIYNKDRFIEFLKHINYEKREREVEWHDFDFIIYGYFLLIKNYAKCKSLNIKTSTSFLEEQHRIDKNEFSKIFNTYNPMWIKNPIDDMKNVFMKLHIDRKLRS